MGASSGGDHAGNGGRTGGGRLVRSGVLLCSANYGLSMTRDEARGLDVLRCELLVVMTSRCDYRKGKTRKETRETYKGLNLPLEYVLLIKLKRKLSKGCNCRIFGERSVGAHAPVRPIHRRRVDYYVGERNRLKCNLPLYPLIAFHLIYEVLADHIG
jgi:hypothetical protein